MEESANREIQLAGASINNGELIIEIREMFKRPEIQASPQCRIQKVPYHIRKWNEEACTPQFISIGPFHRENKRLKSMEEHKERYFKSFIQRSRINLEDVVSTIRELEESIRGCYLETIELKSDEFVKMILVDACFILELFIRSSSESSTSDDPIILKPMSITIMHDLLLLENQLPFFVIEKLYHLAIPSLTNHQALIDLTSSYFALYKIPDHSNVEIKHFTDLLRTFRLPPLKKLPKRDSELIPLLYSATHLHEAGVKFEVGSSESFLDIKFEKGVLKIPCIILDYWMEIVYRNVMALEQTYYLKNGYITDYFWLLDSLINTEKDVDLLCENKVMINFLGDNDAVKSMINNLNYGIYPENRRSDYNDLCENLNRFCRNPCHSWKATLKSQYFSNPWRTVATIAAIILLLLTLLQTICTIIQIV